MKPKAQYCVFRFSSILHSVLSIAYYYGTRGRVTWHSLIFPGIKIHIGQIIGSSIQSFFEISVEIQRYIEPVVVEPERNTVIDDIVLIKAGVKLPKSFDQWKLANDYFTAALPIAEITTYTLPTIISNMNNVIYSYFEQEFGVVNSTKNADLDNKYNGYSNYKLKSCLKQLKNSGADIAEIRYVSHLLRNRLNKSRPANSDRNYDEKIRVNFWGYVKKIFKKSAVKLPSFDVSTCTDFFSKFFSSLNTTKNFQIPDWIPSLPLPTAPFDLSPPSYKQITKVVRRIKASGSTCPLDQLSIIPFKRCPYLRSYLTEVFRTVWKSGEIPNEWKKACTVLIHKKVTNLTLLTLGPLLWKALL